MIGLGRFAVFGSVFEVWGDEPLAAELELALADLRHEPPGAGDSIPGRWSGERSASIHRLTAQLDRGVWTIRWDERERYVGPDLDVALYDSLIAVNVYGARVAVESGYAVLHGGAIGVNGRAVAFVGQSRSGKSTLTTAMARAGFAYLADEVIAVDTGGVGARASDDVEETDLVVVPFHRPIGLRSGGAAAIGFTIPAGPYASVHPYSVGVGGVLSGPIPLELVVLLQRGGECEPEMDHLEPGPALFELCQQTLGAADLELPMFRRLENLVRRVPVGVLRYGHVEDAVRFIASTMHERAAVG